MAQAGVAFACQFDAAVYGCNVQLIQKAGENLVSRMDHTIVDSQQPWLAHHRQ